MELIFDAAGDIDAMEAERPDPRATRKRAAALGVGRFGDYGEIGGRRVPLTGEVGNGRTG